MWGVSIGADEGVRGGGEGAAAATHLLQLARQHVDDPFLLRLVRIDQVLLALEMIYRTRAREPTDGRIRHGPPCRLCRCVPLCLYLLPLPLLYLLFSPLVPVVGGYSSVVFLATRSSALTAGQKY